MRQLSQSTQPPDKDLHPMVPSSVIKPVVLVFGRHIPLKCPCKSRVRSASLYSRPARSRKSGRALPTREITRAGNLFRPITRLCLPRRAPLYRQLCWRLRCNSRLVDRNHNEPTSAFGTKADIQARCGTANKNTSPKMVMPKATAAIGKRICTAASRPLMPPVQVTNGRADPLAERRSMDMLLVRVDIASPGEPKKDWNADQNHKEQRDY